MTSCQRGGHVAFLCALIVNLSMIGFYRRAFAAAPVPAGAMAGTIATVNTAMLTGCDDGLLEGDIADYEDLFAEQELIYETLFVGDFSWCTGSGWLLDEEITHGPDSPTETVPYGGMTVDGQAFVLWLSVFVPIEGYEGDLPPEELQFAIDTDFTATIVGGAVDGPLGTIELWGLTGSMTDDSGSRVSVLIPLASGDVLPAGAMAPERWGYDLSTAYGRCMHDAAVNRDLCLDHAKASLAACLAGDIVRNAVVGGLSCLTRKIRWMPPKAALTVCLLGAGLAILDTLVSCGLQWAADKAHCEAQYEADVAACERDADGG